MNRGFLAPQFGLGRMARSELDEAFKPAPQPAPGAVPPTQGPTVIVKRRRHLPGAGADAAHPPAEVPAEARTQKVYRLDAAQPLQAAQAPQAPQPASPAESVSPALAPPAVQGAQPAGAGDDGPRVSPARRRRDSVRQPTLVRHVVFEPPPARPEAGASMAGGREVGRQVGREVGRAEVLAAMEHLGGMLDALVRGRDAYLALDEHLSALGIANAR